MAASTSTAGLVVLGASVALVPLLTAGFFVCGFHSGLAPALTALAGADWHADARTRWSAATARARPCG